ncbi:hypothetical protein KIW84_051712 [Lathyrus oleraceus]|uniref:Uncharacterized protein n=1 Tax=Pisum sativum TaxID=3888 RepID=A0A9D4WN73_PEA|nr:hypothetical protein KIW84_051712 [Pisum sativum]
MFVIVAWKIYCKDFKDDVGNGDQINLWRDNWCVKVLVDLLHIPKDIHIHLKAKLKDIIHGNSIVIPSSFIILFLDLIQMAYKIHINPIKEDDVLWIRLDSEQLSIKDTYTHVNKLAQGIGWGKLTWHPSIPPSVSLLL